jgi:Uma2 family endonuclease
MTASILTNESDRNALEELLRPAPLADGTEPEVRVVYSGISWGRYLAFDKKLGDDRPGPRLYFLDDQLEIMSTSDEHERIKKWLGGFMEDYFLEKGIEIMPRGQATMRLEIKAAGAEPDESWCVGEEKKFPDLALEIALTSGGVNKLEVYRRFQVPEVWFWRRNRVEIFVLGRSGQYKPSASSQLLPGLNTALLERCVAIRNWQKARKTFRAALSKTK